MCQIAYLNEIGSTDLFLKTEQLLNTFFRTLRITSFITYNKRSKSRKKNSTKEGSKESATPPSYGLKPGDIVKIRSKEQILQTLDKDNRLGGCFFMDEMWQYCGSKQKVLKRVEYFIKEAEFRMLKTHNTVLLEGIHCSGKLLSFKHSCDRNCNFFWREEWLEKIG